jgi:hypothetical protein
MIAKSLFLLNPSQKILKKNISAKIRRRYFQRKPLKYMKLVSLLWPPVMATHDRTRLARALHAGSNLWLHTSGSYLFQKKTTLYIQYSVMSVRS